MDTNAMVGKVQNLLLRIGIDDKLTACLILACAVTLVAHAIRGNKRVSAYIPPFGTSWLQNQGII